jgi:hypothetical protein
MSSHMQRATNRYWQGLSYVHTALVRVELRGNMGSRVYVFEYACICV